MKKLGHGEVEPIDKRFTRSAARIVFLEYIKDDEKASEVLKDLLGLPLRSFIDAGLSPLELWPIRDYIVRLHGRKLYVLRRSLTDWANKWHLNVDWVLDTVCWTLDSWRIHPPSTGELYWLHKGVSWVRLSSRDFKDISPPFGFPQWEADNQFRNSYERYAKEKIEEHINQDIFIQGLRTGTKLEIISECMEHVSSYCDKVLNVYLSQKDSRGIPQWKIAEQREEFERNFRWTIRFQVFGESFSKIAQEDSKAVSTVKRAIEDTLALIEIPKRDDAKPGRKRGSKESEDSRRRSVKRGGLFD